MFKLRTAGGGVEGNEDRAEPRRREPGVDDLDPVLRHDRDAVAGDDPGLAERPGEARDHIPHLREAAPDLTDLQVGPVADGVGLTLEERRQRPLSRWHVVHAGRTLPAGEALSE